MVGVAVGVVAVGVAAGVAVGVAVGVAAGVAVGVAAGVAVGVAVAVAVGDAGEATTIGAAVVCSPGVVAAAIHDLNLSFPGFAHLQPPAFLHVRLLSNRAQCFALQSRKGSVDEEESVRKGG